MGGERFQIGQEINVYWATCGVPLDEGVYISLGQDDLGFFVNLADGNGGTPNDGHFDMSLPDTIKPGEYDLAVKTSTNNAQNTIIDITEHKINIVQ